MKLVFPTKIVYFCSVYPRPWKYLCRFVIKKILAFQSWLQKLLYRINEMKQINIINVAGKDGLFSVYNWVRTPIHLWTIWNKCHKIFDTFNELKLSYYVINTDRSMPFNTLPFSALIGERILYLLLPKLMKGYFNLNHQRPKVNCTWDISKNVPYFNAIK